MIGQRIDIAAAWLRAGNIVGIPTETVYGLAANALSRSAVTRVFEAKQRPFFDPLIVHVSTLEDIDRYAVNVPPVLRSIALEYMPGPVTLLLEKSDSIPDLVTAGSKFVALRMPRHPLTRQLLSVLDFPLAAPSANPFGYVSPTTAVHVSNQLGVVLPYILDGGPCDIGLESTIIGVEDGVLTVYRKGGLAVEDLRRFSDRVAVNEHSVSNPQAPGMLASHYAPRTTVRICSDFGAIDFQSVKAGIITFGPEKEAYGEERRFELSNAGDLNEAAGRLFSILRETEQYDLDVIYVKLVPETGLGRAINDRLRRAAAKN